MTNNFDTTSSFNMRSCFDTTNNIPASCQKTSGRMQGYFVINKIFF